MFIHEIKLTVQTDQYKNYFLSLGTNLFSLNLIKHFATTYPLDGDPFVIFITNNYFVFVFFTHEEKPEVGSLVEPNFWG
jgi:hypothetical protein